LSEDKKAAGSRMLEQSSAATPTTELAAMAFQNGQSF
jgi:hypothetical protein